MGMVELVAFEPEGVQLDMTMGVSMGQMSASLIGTVTPRMFSGLTWEQVTELRDSIAKAERSPEILAAAVEQTSPQLAATFRNSSTASLASAANLATIIAAVVAILGLMVSIYDVLLKDKAVSPAQVIQIIEQTTTVSQTTNINPPPVATHHEPPTPGSS